MYVCVFILVVFRYTLSLFIFDSSVLCVTVFESASISSLNDMATGKWHFTLGGTAV